eukprot:m.802561 g.802561  ORF g.802561 m.802561 type:complete len:173 (-) comp23362_c0_seq3:1796-2314(-)
MPSARLLTGLIRSNRSVQHQWQALRRTMADDASANVGKSAASVVTETATKPPSRIRAVFFGFLAGVASATVGGYFVLEDEIKVTAAQLKTSVQSINEEIEKVSGWLEAVESLAAEVTWLKSNAARREELAKLAEDVKAEREELELTMAQHKKLVHDAQTEMFAAIDRMQSRR